MPNTIFSRSQYPLIVVVPTGAYIPLPDGISDILSLIKWLGLSQKTLRVGVYTVSFLADDEFDLPILSATYYGNGRWGTSRIDTAKDSPFIEVSFTPEDMHLLIDHVAEKVPEGTTVVSLGATADDCLPFGYQGRSGLLLSFESDSRVLATLDIYWEVNNQSCQVLWELPYIAGNLTPFRDESIIVPGFVEALAVAEGIRDRIGVNVKLVREYNNEHISNVIPMHNYMKYMR